MNRTEYALERILKIAWEDDGSKLNSQEALMIEYTRRMGIWAKRYNLTGRWPFFDVGLLIAPDIRAPEEFIAQVKKIGQIKPHNDENLHLVFTLECHMRCRLIPGNSLTRAL